MVDFQDTFDLLYFNGKQVHELKNLNYNVNPSLLLIEAQLN